MAGAPLTFPRFRSRMPWWGRDLQTLRNYILKKEPSLTDYPAERLEFPMTDGDRLVASLHRPHREREGVQGQRSLVILIHGLTGSEDSAYIRTSARHLLEQGYPVLRLNLRGAGPSQGLCRSRYHAGRSEDLRQLLGQMDGRLAGSGLLLVGYSLGGNLMLKYLGEAGRRAMALPLLPEIRVPTLIIHARNDPWIPFASYRDVDWAANPRLLPLFARGGGHVGFHGRGSPVPWHDRCMAVFFARYAA